MNTSTPAPSEESRAAIMEECAKILTRLERIEALLTGSQPLPVPRDEPVTTSYNG